jgi:signal transduction histidine kinase
MSRKVFAKLYMWLLVAAGAIICCVSVYNFVTASRHHSDWHLLILALIAIGLGPCLTVRIPRLTSQITVFDTFIFLTLLLYGGEAAVLLAALEAFCASLRFSRKAITILSNSAVMACSTFLTSWVLSLSFGSVSELPRLGYSPTLLVALCLMALVQYVANSGLVAVGVALKLQRPVLQTWSKHYLWSSITYVAGASAAGIIARLVNTIGFYSVAATAPIIAVIFLTYRTYSENIDAAAAQAKQAQEHAEVLSLYIAQRRRAEEERDQLLIREQQARADAEEANRMKDEFLALVSHELRTPLTPILGWVRMLRQGELDPATSSDALESIERAAKNQEFIINDLLDVSRIIRGKLHLEIKPVSLRQVIEAALEVVRPAAEAKRILINCSYDSTALTVSGDSGRLKQIVWNILSNAVKFTRIDGRIDLERKPQGSHAQIQVRDNGIGISADFLPHVFERFRQADAPNNQALAGLGLGLALARYLTEMHGGRIEAESLGLGHGATFTVRLPLVKAQHASSFKHIHVSKASRIAFSNGLSVKGLPQLHSQHEKELRAASLLGNNSRMN